MTNIRKHAEASRVIVTFSKEGNLARIQVDDNGKGFDVVKAANRADKGFGLYTMRERAESVGGKITINSIPGKGTSVVVWVPMEVGKEVNAHGHHKNNGG